MYTDLSSNANLNGEIPRSMGKSKRKPKKFTVGAEARRRARESAGPPPAQRIIPDKRLKPAKHKEKLINIAES
jgi:hypothetical protein